MTTVTDATGTAVLAEGPARRIVSLVPSISETLSALGVAERVVGLTTFCVRPAGAFPHAARVRGTKNPDVDAIVALRPDLVLANLEENRESHVGVLREAGVTVHVSHPRSVEEAARCVRDLGALVGRGDRARVLADSVLHAAEEVAADAPPPLPVVCPIWRDPWMVVAGGTYAADLLRTVGFQTIPRDARRYPEVALGALRGDAGAVLLPSEPYEFTDRDRAVFSGWEVPVRLIDGELLTWHGARTPAALRYLAALRRELER